MVNNFFYKIFISLIILVFNIKISMSMNCHKFLLEMASGTLSDKEIFTKEAIKADPQKVKRAFYNTKSDKNLFKHITRCEFVKLDRKMNPRPKVLPNPPNDSPRWMSLCHKLNLSHANMEMLRLYVKNLGINSADKSRRELCAILAKSYDEYLSLKNTEEKFYKHKFVCKGSDCDIDFTSWENIPPEDIFIDTNNFCFSYADAKQLISFKMSHPITQKPLDTITSKKGQTLSKFYKNRHTKKKKSEEYFKKLEQVHLRLGLDYIESYELKLNEAINKYTRGNFNNNILIKAKNDSTEGYLTVLGHVRNLYMAKKYRKSLNDLYNMTKPPIYAEFLTILVNSIASMPKKHKKEYATSLNNLLNNWYVGIDIYGCKVPGVVK